MAIKPGFVAFTANNIQDALGNPLPAGYVFVRPTDANDIPLNVPSGGAGGVITSATTAKLTVTNGAFPASQIADTGVTGIPNICYRITIADATGTAITVYRKVQTSGAALNLDTYKPNVAPQIPVQPGPQGPSGTIAIGSVASGAAAVVNTGTPSEAVLNFTLPPGQQGPAATVAVGAVAGGAAAAVTNTGTPTAAVLNFTLPQGPPGASSISLPIYANTAAGVAAGTGVAANGYFLVPSTKIDGLYDNYQNVAGAAVFKDTINLPAAKSNGDFDAVIDAGGFIVIRSKIVNGTIQYPAIESRLEAVETTSAEFTEEAAQGNFTLFSKFTLGIPLALVDDGGFVYTITDPSGNSPAVAQALAPRDLLAQIQELNTTCLAFSRALTGQYNPEMGAVEYFYNMMIYYGQSLSTGFQTTTVYSKTQKYGNLTIGTQPQLVNGGGNSLPWTNTAFNPLIEVAVPGGSGQGESETSGTCNFGKSLLNRYQMLVNDPNRTLVGVSWGVPGVPIAQLLPGGPIDGTGFPSWDRMVNGTGWAAANAAAAGKTIGVAGTFYLQGENDISGTAPAVYAADMMAMRSAMDALYSSTFSAQVRQAPFYTYQTGGAFANDVNNMGLQMVQLNQACTQPNWFMFGPHYAYPDLGGHLTANSYRWLGSMAAKVWFRTCVLRQGWRPLSPHKTAVVGNTLLVGFHVPVPPLTVATAYNIATPVNFSDLGFSLFDAAGYVSCSVSIVAETVIQFIPARTVDWATAFLRYADEGGNTLASATAGPLHFGRGNLTDSDTTVTEDLYVAPDGDDPVLPVTTPAQPSTAYDIPGLSGLPYKLNNWCASFHIPALNYLA